MKKSVLKVRKDFCGICELRQLQNGTYFKILNSKGEMSKETYTKEYYERELNKYICSKHSDIWGNGRALKGSTIVTTDFIY